MTTLAELLGLDVEQDAAALAAAELHSMLTDRVMEEFIADHRAPPTEDDLNELNVRLAQVRRLTLN